MVLAVKLIKLRVSNRVRHLKISVVSSYMHLITNPGLERFSKTAFIYNHQFGLLLKRIPDEEVVIKRSEFF